ncbi:helix-turn-helix domain-containing protein [Actinomadura madurae]|nr:helix-turn-helix domain-containing protein [Actinomadura madurae]MCP9982782.1 helix-turn-helix domain-containing protein [Actinomadura madurae]
MSMDPGKIGTIKVLDKAAAILQVLRERERVTPADLVETVGESRTTVVRICETLVRHGLLEREDSSRVSYRLGLTLLELGALTRQRLSIRDVAHPVLVELSAKTGDSTNLVVRRDDAAVCLIRVVGSYPVVSQALYEGGRAPLRPGRIQPRAARVRRRGAPGVRAGATRTGPTARRCGTGSRRSARPATASAGASSCRRPARSGPPSSACTATTRSPASASAAWSAGWPTTACRS